MKATPLPIRERILALIDEGVKVVEIARVLGVSKATVNNIRRHFNKHGTLEPLKPGKPRERALDEEGVALLKTLIDEKPDRTLDELAELLTDKGYPIDRSSVHVYSTNLGYTFKKKFAERRNKIEKTSPPSGRRLYRLNRTWIRLG